MNRSTIVAFILGLAVATATTATATTLISGKNIKDGSISSKDLSSYVRAQLAKAGKAGPAGRAGEQGVRGPEGSAGVTGAQGPAGPQGLLADTLPVGKTLTGMFTVSGYGSQPLDISKPYNVIDFDRGATDISFGVRLPNAPQGHFIRWDDPTKPPECPGTAANPTAAPGNLCVYEDGAQNVAPGRDLCDLATCVRGGGKGVSIYGSTISVAAVTGGQFDSAGTWAVTAG